MHQPNSVKSKTRERKLKNGINLVRSIETEMRK